MSPERGGGFHPTSSDPSRGPRINRQGRKEDIRDQLYPEMGRAAPAPPHAPAQYSTRR